MTHAGALSTVSPVGSKKVRQVRNTQWRAQRKKRTQKKIQAIAHHGNGADTKETNLGLREAADHS